MSSRSLNASQKTAKTKGGKFLPAICNVLGIFILLGVIALLVPLTGAKLMGYNVYNVISGSMEPTMPVGSIVYVESVAGSAIKEGDIIAFESDGTVITHRVVSNKVVEGEFITKGDANEEPDMQPIPYSDVIGRVKRHIPKLGELLNILTTTVGKVYLFCLIACGFMFNMLASALRKRRSNKYR